jgi:hypothetical protein
LPKQAAPFKVRPLHCEVSQRTGPTVSGKREFFMSASLRNQNARKPEAEKARAFLYIRCRLTDKTRWREIAEQAGQKLTPWVIGHLNAGCPKKCSTKS